MARYDIHEDFDKFKMLHSPMNPHVLPLVNMGIALIFKGKKCGLGLVESRYVIKGYNGMDVRLTVYEPSDVGQDAPCLIYLHGGAFVLRASAHHKFVMQSYAANAACKVVYVDYHLAPKHPYPAGLNDCYAAFEWVYENAQMLGIDRNKIAVGGDSAGGALASSVCLMARDRNAHKICFQLLIYPVTDSRQCTASMLQYQDTPLWNAKQNAKMWKLYLKNGLPEHDEYASPMLAKSHDGLPPAFVEVAEFDCLHDEGLAYAQALASAGIPVEIYESRQTIHGYEVAEKSEIVRASISRRVDALNRAFRG